MHDSTVLETLPTPIASDTLRLFHEGVDRYRPAACGLELEEETGSPEASTRNLARLLEGDRLIARIWMAPGRALVLFNTWETHLALGLSLDDPEKREALTRLASQNHFGEYEQLKRFYDAIPADTYDGHLPDIDR